MTVTTADGTEYKFDGLMEQWHAHLVTALTARGREVRATAETSRSSRGRWAGKR